MAASSPPPSPVHAVAGGPRFPGPQHEPPPPIGPRLKQYRLREELTLSDLQALTGISKSMLSQIERGKVNPTFARVWHLTRSLGIGVGELLAKHDRDSLIRGASIISGPAQHR